MEKNLESGFTLLLLQVLLRELLAGQARALHHGHLPRGHPVAGGNSELLGLSRQPRLHLCGSVTDTHATLWRLYPRNQCFIDLYSVRVRLFLSPRRSFDPGSVLRDAGDTRSPAHVAAPQAAAVRRRRAQPVASGDSFDSKQVPPVKLYSSVSVGFSPPPPNVSVQKYLFLKLLIKFV